MFSDFVSRIWREGVCSMRIQNAGGDVMMVRRRLLPTTFFQAESAPADCCARTLRTHTERDGVHLFLAFISMFIWTSCLFVQLKCEPAHPLLRYARAWQHKNSGITSSSFLLLLAIAKIYFFLFGNHINVRLIAQWLTQCKIHPYIPWGESTNAKFVNGSRRSRGTVSNRLPTHRISALTIMAIAHRMNIWRCARTLLEPKRNSHENWIQQKHLNHRSHCPRRWNVTRRVINFTGHVVASIGCPTSHGT